MGDDRADKEATLKVLEKLTTNAANVQNQVLLQILSQNSNTEYLSRFHLQHCLHDANFVKQAFRERVPIVNTKISRIIQLVASGEPSHIICAQPITEFITSSGTSGGQPKLIPSTAEEMDRRMLFRSLAVPVIKYVDGMDQGKVMSIVMTEPEITTPSGLVARPVSTSYYKYDRFKNHPSKSNLLTSPRDTILCSDSRQSMYCQLVCRLVQRDEVLQIATLFVVSILRVVKFLEAYWKEMCANIKTGQVSQWITDVRCRNATSVVLGKPCPELADLIEMECGGRSWEGLFERLWPRTKYINAIHTGSMAQYIPTVEFYCDHIPLVSTIYSSSECFFGINLKPFSKPSDVSYTFLPNMAYFEFLPVIKDRDEEEAVDLINVKVGHCYELLVTTCTGLYRYQVGDILMVTSFHNNAPQFRYVERRNMGLSVDVEKTTEDELLKAVMQAKLPIEKLGFFLKEYTTYADTSSTPGHYVVFWELVKKNGGKERQVEVDQSVMEECCFKMEKMLNSTNQFKMTRCVKSEEDIKILESGVVGRYFSNNAPAWEPFEILEPIKL